MGDVSNVFEYHTHVTQDLRDRRLGDKILVAFNLACDIGDLQTAREILDTLELLFSRPSSYGPADRRKTLEDLVQAHQRLWLLKNFAIGPLAQ